MTVESGIPQVWLGRVFTAQDTGGNHTAVVLPSADPLDPAALARTLAVPDTAVITDVRPGEVRLRTYTPVEELAQCWQTSLAAPVALAAPEGTPWRVRHERGDVLLVHREKSTCWAQLAEPREPVTESAPWPAFVHAAPASDTDGPAAQVLREARSRLYLRCADAAGLAELDVAAADVLRLCARSRTNGVVLSADQPDGTVRVRVFTTSLAGHEDNATGGAVLGVGLLAARQGVRGDLVVRQGPPDPARQGHLRLRIESATQVALGGEVLPIMTGRLPQL